MDIESILTNPLVNSLASILLPSGERDFPFFISPNIAKSTQTMISTLLMDPHAISSSNILFSGPRFSSKKTTCLLLANMFALHQSSHSREHALSHVILIDPRNNPSHASIDFFRNSVEPFISMSHKKIVVILDCDMLSPSAARALLTSMEVPSVSFLCTTSSYGSLISALKSRLCVFDMNSNVPSENQNMSQSFDQCDTQDVFSKVVSKMSSSVHCRMLLTDNNSAFIKDGAMNEAFELAFQLFQSVMEKSSISSTMTISEKVRLFAWLVVSFSPSRECIKVVEMISVSMLEYKHAHVKEDHHHKPLHNLLHSARIQRSCEPKSAIYKACSLASVVGENDLVAGKDKVFQHFGSVVDTWRTKTPTLDASDIISAMKSFSVLGRVMLDNVQVSRLVSSSQSVIDDEYQSLPSQEEFASSIVHLHSSLSSQ